MSAATSRLFDEAFSYVKDKFPEPREFQRHALAALRQGFLDGHKNQMLMAPTGAGKTYLGLLLAQEALAEGQSVSFICDRTTIVNQTSETADKYGLRAHAIVQAGHRRRDSSLAFQIASVQTVAKRGFLPEADLYIIDEAHTQHKGWTEPIQRTKARCVGLSATPFSAGLSKLFSNLVNATTMNDLTRSGVLVPMRVFTCKKVDMEGAATLGGEWTEAAAEERGMEIIGDVVREWLKYAADRKTIVFGATIAHCLELCREFVEAGVSASTFTAETTPEERAVLLAEYRKPDSTLRVLISVEALAKGFDVADVGCVVDCRPLRKSLSTAIQMWGRGLRCSPETGKTDCLLLDHSGNIQRFREDYKQIFMYGLNDLDAAEKMDAKVRNDEDNEQHEPQVCPSCGYQPFARCCIACGQERPRPDGVSVVPGEMEEMVISAAATGGKDAWSLWSQVCTYARAHSPPDRQAGRAWHLYKEIAGAEPANSWTFASAPHTEITKVVRNKITSLNFAWRKSPA